MPDPTTPPAGAVPRGTEVAAPGRAAGDLPLAAMVKATDAAMSYHTKNNVAISYTNTVILYHITRIKSLNSNSFYSGVWLIKLKDKNNQYYVDKPFESVPQDSITRWEIKNNIYMHYPGVADTDWATCESPGCTHPGPSFLKGESRLNL